MKVYIGIAGDLKEDEIFFYNGTVERNKEDAIKFLDKHGGCDTILMEADLEFKGIGSGFEVEEDSKLRLIMKGAEGRLTLNGEVEL